MAEIGHLHHIGYLVKNMDHSLKAFQALGYSLCSEVVFDDLRQSDIAFLSNGGVFCNIELVAPHKESDIYPLLKIYKNSPYHLCYEVDGIDEVIKLLKKMGFMMFKKVEPAMAIGPNAKVAFMMNTSIGMIEIVQQGER